MKSILIVDKHWIVCWALQQLVLTELQVAKADICDNKKELMDRLKSHQYDILVLNPCVEKTLSGPEKVRHILSYFPSLSILVVCPKSERDKVKEYFRQGALGFIESGAPVIEFKTAISNLDQNNCYLDKVSLFSIIAESQKTIVNNKKSIVNKIGLTIREHEIAKLLLDGQSSKNIGLRLSLKASTISTYKHRIYQKMEVTNVIDLYYKLAKYNSTGYNSTDDHKVKPFKINIYKKQQ